MSVYRPKRKDGSFRSPYWHYELLAHPAGSSKRFHASTGVKINPPPQAENRARALATEGKLTSTKSLNEACCKYWDEVAKVQPSAEDTGRALEHLERLLGASTLLIDITADMIAQAVTRRAAEPVTLRKRVTESAELKAVRSARWLPCRL
jgi:hypothetical protein